MKRLPLEGKAYGRGWKSAPTILLRCGDTFVGEGLCALPQASLVQREVSRSDGGIVWRDVLKAVPYDVLADGLNIFFHSLQCALFQA